MSYEPKAHDAQLAILRKLLFTPSCHFAELQKASSLTSDHFSFHIKKLVDEGYVEKDGVSYKLSTKGKEYSNRLDTDENVIEKQPKISVAIALERTNGEGEREYLFQQRKKNPFYDFWGRVGGKIRWGETIIDAGCRELLEETGLTAELSFKMMYHKRDYDKKSGVLLEDKIFIFLWGDACSGELIESFEGGINRWMTFDEFHAQPKYFTSVDIYQQMMDRGEVFAEREFYYDKTEY